MSLQRWFTTAVVLLLVALVIGICFENRAIGEDTKKGAPDAAAKSTAVAATIDSAKLDQAQRDAWHKNIAEWREWEPDELADNSFCNVCHANLEDEKLVRIHRSKGVGCETCHGISDTHSEDEDSLVPPDVMFAKSKIVLFCTECHDKDELIEADSDHKKLFAAVEKSQTLKTPLQFDGKKQRTCTDCHSFKHAIKTRTRRWNKDTRKIEWYDGVRMMQQRDK